MAERSSLRAIAEELTLLFAPMADAMRSLDAFKTFMYRLGWRVDSLPPAFRTLGTAARDAVASVAALDDDPDPDEIVRAMGAVRDVHNALLSLTEAPTGVDPEGFLAEIADGLFDLLLLDYLLERAPVLYRLLAMT